MKYDKFDDSTHSQILITNIKRWNKISNKFHFGNSEKNTTPNIIPY
jgi:Leucine-rich repeat (LRR) protein